MALLFADSGGLVYTGAQATTGFYQSGSSFAVVTSGLPVGAVGSSALDNPGNAIIPFPVTTSPGPYFAGYRSYFTSMPNGVMASFNDSAQGTQVSFYSDYAGHIRAFRGNAGTLLGTSNDVVKLGPNQWNYLEFGVTVSTTVGVVTIKINGTTVLNLTNVNTQATGNANAAFFFIASANLPAFNHAYVQDLYVSDTTTALNNTFLGDIHVGAYKATSNGTFTAYTPNGAAALWQCVNTLPAADSTIFASDTTVGDKMSVNLGSTSIAGNIIAVVNVARMEQSAASPTKQASIFSLSGGTELDAAAVSLTTAYKFYQQFVPTDPSTGAAWTVAGFNASQPGVKTVA